MSGYSMTQQGMLDIDGAPHPVDRRSIAVLPRDTLGDFLVVDELKLRERRGPSGPRLVLRWRRTFKPLGQAPHCGEITLGDFGDLTADQYGELKRLICEALAAFEERLDINALMARLGRAAA